MPKFPKEERLYLEKQIDELFQKGKSINAFPVRMIWQIQPGNVPARILFSVPKRKFKHAVDRNRIKRLMREAYRLNKTPFVETLQKEEKQVVVAFLFNGHELPKYKGIADKIILLLQRLSNELQSNPS